MVGAGEEVMLAVLRAWKWLVGTDEIPTVKRLKNTRNIIKDIAQMGILIIWSKFLKPSGLTSSF